MHAFLFAYPGNLSLLIFSFHKPAELNAQYSEDHLSAFADAIVTGPISLGSENPFPV